MADGSLSQFKATLARRQARKDKNSGKFDRNSLDYSSTASKTEFDFPVLSHADLEDLKGKIRTDIRIQKRKELVFYLVVIVLTIFLFFSLIN
ncbi:hypothetical protein ABXZ32_10870 [Sediminicola luteus]|uniref:Riboflavin synthase subunit beta n=1 Tax=Sediminicola luteus TaxID=319238 RepID=A0ABV2TXA6_9FLAO